jgi:hypothetical protein
LSFVTSVPSTSARTSRMLLLFKRSPRVAGQKEKFKNDVIERAVAPP